MTEILYLLVIFALLNVLDGYTTWLGLHKLPPELRGREKNPIFKEDAEKHFRVAMLKKAAFVLFGIWFLYRFANVHAVKALDLALAVVVLNNGYIYLSRRISGKRLRGPAELFEVFLQKLHLPERVARVSSFYILIGLILIGCYFLAGSVS